MYIAIYTCDLRSPQSDTTVSSCHPRYPSIPVPLPRQTIFILRVLLGVTAFSLFIHVLCKSIRSYYLLIHQNLPICQAYTILFRCVLNLYFSNGVYIILDDHQLIES